MPRSFDPTQFRQVLGQYPTGVVVVTALDADGVPLGMTVGSFTSVSLDPPLVAFLPDKASSSWRALRESGSRFCVNVLGAHQEDVCRAVAMRKHDKLAGIAWTPSPAGLPVIEGAAAWIDCVTDQIHDAGDHHIVVGRVSDLQVGSAELPLLFFRGGYGSFAPLSLAAGDADLLEHLRRIDLVRSEMDDLAAHFDTEVTAITLVRNELVLVAAAGSTDLAVSPTRVGQRIPFRPPLGSCFAAWGDGGRSDYWVAAADPAVRTVVADVPARVRERGYSFALGHAAGERLEYVTTRVNEGAPDVTTTALSEAMLGVVDGYNVEELDDDVELRMLTAPVFGADGQVAFTLTLWGPSERVARADIEARAAALLETAAVATARIGGRAPLLQKH